MNTEYYKFFEKKNDLILLVFLFLLSTYIFCASLCFLVIDDRVAMYKQIIKITLILCFFITLSTFVLRKLLSKKVYIEITPSYIKIGNFEKLLWTDISRVYVQGYIRGSILALEVKEISKYNLTLNQKLNMKMGYPPFFITYATLKKEDLSNLKHILEERIKESS